MNPETLRLKQRGAALLIFFLILFTTAAAVMLRAVNNIDFSTRTTVAEQQEMVAAKEALLAFAMSSADNYAGQPPGRFPCPDTNNDNESDTPCTNYARGRLPERIEIETDRIFAISENVQDIDRRLWYVVDPVYAVAPGGTLNSDIDGSLTLDGQNDIVALIIAPGGALPGQLRNDAANRRNPVNYIEAGSGPVNEFVSSLPANPTAFNDRVLPIYRHELMPLVTLKVAMHIRDALEASGLPYPSLKSELESVLDSHGDEWFEENKWHEILDIVHIDSNYVSFNFTGCAIPYTITYSNLKVTRTPTSCPE